MSSYLRWVVNYWRYTLANRQKRSLGITDETIHLSGSARFRKDSAKPINPCQLAIGSYSSLQGIYSFSNEGKLTIGKYCSLRSGTRISVKQSITFGDYVFGAPNVFISDNDNHPTSPKLRKEMTMCPPNSPPWKLTMDVASSPIVIEDGVWLGLACTILKGVTVGKWSIVGANAVVTKNVPPFSIVVGNPGLIVKKIPNDLE